MRNKGGGESGKWLELVSDCGDICTFVFFFYLATILVGAAKCLSHLSFLIVFYGLQHHFFSKPTLFLIGHYL